MAAPQQEILIHGANENGKTIVADRIQNFRTGQSITDLQTMPPDRAYDMSPLASDPIEKGSKDRTISRKQKSLAAYGTIQSQLYNHEGEVNGLILSEGSIVRFPPHLINDSVKINVGENIHASGYGIKNSKGQSIEAQQIRN